MNKNTKTYQKTLEKIKNEIAVCGSCIIGWGKGSRREFDAALSILDDLDTPYKGERLDHTTLKITEIR